VTWVFQQIAGGALQGLTSVVTLSEVLVQPLMRGDIRIQQEYRDCCFTAGIFKLFRLITTLRNVPLIYACVTD